MNNDLEHSDYIRLIGKYLARECDAQEIKLLEDWVLADEANKKLFNQYKQTWRLTNPEATGKKIAVDAEWEKIHQELFAGDKEEAEIIQMQPRREASTAQFIRLAAVFLIVVGAALWLLKLKQSHGNIKWVADNSVEVNKLPDGSTITLNLQSKLTYPKKFRGKTRTVSLEGDAFFEVARNEKKPFIIKTQNVEIEVLGTSFYVNAHKNDATVEVTVKTGKVAVRSAGKSIVLIPNQKGIFDKSSGQLQKTNNDDVNFIAWKTKHFEFRDDKLTAVIAKLNAAYHSDIVIKDKALNDCRLTATFDRKDVTAVIEIIKETLGLTVEKQGDKYLIISGTCR